MKKVVVRLVLSREFIIFANAKFGDEGLLLLCLESLEIINYNIILLCHYLE